MPDSRRLGGRDDLGHDSAGRVANERTDIDPFGVQRRRRCTREPFRPRSEAPCSFADGVPVHDVAGQFGQRLYRIVPELQQPYHGCIRSTGSSPGKPGWWRYSADWWHRARSVVFVRFSYCFAEDTVAKEAVLPRNTLRDLIACTAYPSS